MAGTTVTTLAKKKMVKARAGISSLPKIVGMAENELANTYISEVGLYDADGDMVAMKAFLKKGKDADMECVFECDDTF